jgi:hypothetical protein
MSVTIHMKIIMTETMIRTIRENRFFRSSRESLRFWGGEFLVIFFMWLLPDILLIRILESNPFYRFLRGNERN